MGANQRLGEVVKAQRARADRVAAAQVRQSVKELRVLAGQAAEIAHYAGEGVRKDQLQAALVSFSAGLAAMRVDTTRRFGEALGQMAESEYQRVTHGIERSVPAAYRDQVRHGQAVGAEIALTPVAGMPFAVALARAFRRIEEDVERDVMAEWGRGFVAAVDEGYRLQESAAVRAATAVAVGVLVKQVRDHVVRGGGVGIGNVVTSHVTATLDVTNRMAWGENRELFAGMRHVTVFDGRECETCAELDGNVYMFAPRPGELGIDDMPMVPIHPKCRCIRIGAFREEIDPEPLDTEALGKGEPKP